MGKALSSLGITPAFIFLLLFVILLFLLYVNVTMKYNRLKSSYMTFMRGKDGKTLEESMKERFAEVDTMGGKLSFALAMLDGKNNGWVINAMHSREGCYTYVKEIVKGESYVELAEEEAEALDKAIFQDPYELEPKEK